MNFETFYSLSYGLYIVSAEYEGKKNGYVANTVFQVTAEPPQIAISCNKENLTSQIISDSGFFSISVLDQDTPKDLIGLFGYKTGKEIEKFSIVKHFISKDNSIPVVTESCVAWFTCRLIKKIDVGTHFLFVGEVLDGDYLEKEKTPLTYDYYRKARHGRSPKNAPTYIAPEKEKKTISEVSASEKSGSQKWICQVCDHIYDPAEGDPEAGIPAGTPFESLPDDWVCPVCGAEKGDFEPYNE